MEIKFAVGGACGVGTSRRAHMTLEQWLIFLKHTEFFFILKFTCIKITTIDCGHYICCAHHIILVRFIRLKFTGVISTTRHRTVEAKTSQGASGSTVYHFASAEIHTMREIEKARNSSRLLRILLRYNFFPILSNEFWMRSVNALIITA